MIPTGAALASEPDDRQLAYEQRRKALREAWWDWRQAWYAEHRVDPATERSLDDEDGA